MRKVGQVFVVVKALESMSIGWIFGTAVLFLLDHGLTLFHANLLNLSFMTAYFLLDPLTGRLADRVGQKRVYVWGQAAFGLGMLIYGLGQTFPVFLVAELTAAVGVALMSEALESWLRNNEDEVVTHRIICRAGVLSPLATIPSAFLGGIVGTVAGRHWPWLLSALSCSLAAIFSFSLLNRLPEGRAANEAGESLSGIWEIARQVWQSEPLRFTVIVALLSTAAFQPFNMFWAPVFRDASGSAWWLGSMWIGISLALALGSYLANHWLELNGVGIAITLLSNGIPILAIAAFSPTWPFLVAGFLAYEIGRGALGPLLFTYSNRHIEDFARTTTNSIRRAGGTFGAVIGLLVSGLLTFILSPLAIWGLSAIALILLAFYARRKG